MPEIEIFPNAAALAQHAAGQFTALAEFAIRKRGRFAVALSGGSTPKPMNALLAAPPFATRIDWSKVYVFWSDERCVAPQDAESNYGNAREALLIHVPIPPENIQRVFGELAPEHAAQKYEDKLREFFAGKAPRFDLVLLGLGEDGHTASLFPGAPAVRENSRWALAVKHSTPPLPLVDRVTLTPPVINAAANVTFLVTGAAKAERLRQVLRDQYNPDRLPAQVVRPKDGKLFWFLDEAAAGKI
ncbi:MAG: 6-phosphogluconolactonase [Anaerolineales bacterium]